MKPRRTIHLLGAGLPASMVASGQDQTGIIQGTAQDSNGKPVAGTLITYSRLYKTVSANQLPTSPVQPFAFILPTPEQPAGAIFPNTPAPASFPGGTLPKPYSRIVPAAGAQIANGHVLVDGSGRFFLSNLPVGDYSLCVVVVAAPYLDTCRWGARATRITITSNSVTAAALTLEKGVFLKVRVNDPNALLPISEGVSPRGNRLLVGVVYGTGAYAAIPMVSADRTGRDYQIVVPPGLSLNLRLFTRELALADAEGKQASTLTVLVPLQGTLGVDQTFTFTITGTVAELN